MLKEKYYLIEYPVSLLHQMLSDCSSHNFLWIEHWNWLLQGDTYVPGHKRPTHVVIVKWNVNMYWLLISQYKNLNYKISLQLVWKFSTQTFLYPSVALLHHINNAWVPFTWRDILLCLVWLSFFYFWKIFWKWQINNLWFRFGLVHLM